MMFAHSFLDESPLRDLFVLQCKYRLSSPRYPLSYYEVLDMRLIQRVHNTD